MGTGKEIDKTPQELLEEAILHEKNSFSMYNRAAVSATRESAKELFKFLAQEEEKHITMLQDEYDKTFQPEN